MKMLNALIAGLIIVTAVQPVQAGRSPQKAAAISDAEVRLLLFMREEEKLARDVYLHLHAIWGDRIFSNIAQSEQRHMDAILNLLEKYGLPDPAKTPGTFSDPALQSLYDGLIERGGVSRVEALKVGVLIEEVDIEDLQAALQKTSSSDLKLVFGNLLSGSENHLRAFERNLSRSSL